MKKRIFSRVLALFMALSMLTTTVFAASFDDLQNAIDGNTSEGTLITGSDYQDHYGYGSQDETTGNWGVESWKEGDTSNVKLNEDVVASETTPTITVDEDQKVNLDLNNNNITGTAGSDVIDVKGDLTITGGEDESKNTISGGKTGINVEEDATLSLDGVTVTNNEIGVSFFDNLSVTFIGDQNVVSGNKTKQISGVGKVNFELTDKAGKKVTYKVDADTAENLLADKDDVAAHGNNWILTKCNSDDNYTIIYAGDQTTLSTPTALYAIKDAAKAMNCAEDKITTFVVPASVENLGNGAFNNCSNLTEIKFAAGSKLKKIDAAFVNCTSLSKINLPDSVEEISASFSDCKLSGDLVLPKNLKTLGKNAFKGCGLKSVKFPASLTSIGDSAFVNCTDLKEIVFADGSAPSIGRNAFAKCTSLEEVTLPADMTELAGCAFDGCEKLERVTLPSGLKTIKDATFRNCAILEKIQIPDSVEVIEGGAFDGAGLEGDLKLPANLKTLGNWAFRNCNVTKVTFPQNCQLTTIGAEAFSSCKKLTTFEIPDGIKNIEFQAFLASSMTFVEFPSSLTKVDPGIFLMSDVKSAVLYLGNGETIESAAAAIKAMLSATSCDYTNQFGGHQTRFCNLYVVEGSNDLSFYRQDVVANFNHAASDSDINKGDGSVALTNVNGTITTNKGTFTLPNVAGIIASIDTDGKITIEIPEGGEEYPYGATVRTDPDDPEGEIVVDIHEAPPVELPEFTFDSDATGADAGTTIEDEEVPLAGLVTLAELLEALRQYEDVEDVELPEDFQWVDHEYAQAIYWGLTEALVVDTEDDPLDPDEIVTVALLREILENFVEYKGANLTVTVEGEDDMIVMDLGERLTVFYGELEAALEGKAA